MALPLITNEICSQTQSITSDRICAGYLNTGPILDGNNGPCAGDGGGPLIVQRNESAVIYGVFRDGIPTCFSGQSRYSTYTRVSKYIDWIQSNMNGE